VISERRAPCRRAAESRAERRRRWRSPRGPSRLFVRRRRGMNRGPVSDRRVADRRAHITGRRWCWPWTENRPANGSARSIHGFDLLGALLPRGGARELRRSCAAAGDGPTPDRIQSLRARSSATPAGCLHRTSCSSRSSLWTAVSPAGARFSDSWTSSSGWSPPAWENKGRACGAARGSATCGPMGRAAREVRVTAGGPAPRRFAFGCGTAGTDTARQASRRAVPPRAETPGNGTASRARASGAWNAPPRRSSIGEPTRGTFGGGDR